MADSSRDQITRLVLHPDVESREEALAPVLYRELQQMAQAMMRTERAGHTLQATALVHEAYIRLVDSEVERGTSRAAFLAAAAKTMRRVLVDHARRSKSEKRGRDWARVTLQLADGPRDDAEVLALHDALGQLTELDRRQAEIVEMHYFAGMTGDEIASHLDVSRRTIVRELRMARAWLEAELG